jgi:hypothetical protein
MENKLTKALTLSEIVAMTLVVGFLGYRAYQFHRDKPYNLTHENTSRDFTNSVYLNSVYDSKEKLK